MAAISRDMTPTEAEPPDDRGADQRRMLPCQLQRSVGALHVGLRLRNGRTELGELRQSGCLKARLPRRVHADTAEIVTLNIGGGVAGGDRLRLGFDLGAGARALISAQAAERFYRARAADPPATVETRITLGEAAIAEWLPQESILYDGAALDRTLAVALSGTSRFLALEMLVFGRGRMGESVRRLTLRDRIQIDRLGQPLLHDRVRLEGDAQARLDRAALGGGARAVGTLVYAAPDAEARVTAVRHALDGRDQGASAEPGLLVARLLAPDAAGLRRPLAAALAVLRGRPLPRVWLC